MRDLSKPLSPTYGDPKKERLANRADKANARAKARGDEQVGTRKTMANPRTLTQGSVPVYKREKKIRDKISNVITKTPKGPKQHWTGRLKTALTRKGDGKPRKTKAEKATCKQKRNDGRARNKRKHDSCKA